MCELRGVCFVVFCACVEVSHDLVLRAVVLGRVVTWWCDDNDDDNDNDNDNDTQERSTNIRQRPGLTSVSEWVTTSVRKRV